MEGAGVRGSGFGWALGGTEGEGNGALLHHSPVASGRTGPRRMRVMTVAAKIRVAIRKRRTVTIRGKLVTVTFSCRFTEKWIAAKGLHILDTALHPIERPEWGLYSEGRQGHQIMTPFARPAGSPQLPFWTPPAGLPNRLRRRRVSDP